MAGAKTGIGFGPTNGPELRPPEILFSYDGAVAVSKSPAYRSRGSRRLRTVACTLDTAGTTATSARILVNATEVFAFTIPANTVIYDAVVPDSSYVAIPAGSRTQVEVTAVGTGAKDLVLQLLTVA